MASLANQTLPIITFSEKNLERGSSSWLSTSKQVVRAPEEFGCFIANYSNFSPELQHAIFKASKEMFDLPTHVKKLNTAPTLPSNGYIKQKPTIALYEALGIENATTHEGVDKFTDLLWPSGNGFFRETALEYSKVVAELDGVVMRMVSDVYGIKNGYESLVESTSYLLRLLKYRAPMKDETNTGFVPHTDKSFMTILQECQVKGLHIQTKSGDWISANPSPSAFIVMAGDACMGWSNGRIESPYHKVVIDHGSEERYSIGVFTFIKGVEIQVPKELVDEDHPLQFKPFDHTKFNHFIYTQEAKRSNCPLRTYCGV